MQSGNPEFDLRAEPGDPDLGVHVLTEFVYCPRAGLLAWESPVDDSGEDRPPPRLDYVPRYDLREMRRLVNRLCLRMVLLLPVTVAWIALNILFIDLVCFWLVLGLPVTWWLFLLLRRTGRRILRLWDSLEAAEAARPRLPDPLNPRNQQVNWWELLQAGFVSRRYEDVLRDDDSRLAGHPWRILALGSLRIPVFRQHAFEGGLHRQHDVRMAAYCFLVERCTGLESPYGIILFGQTYLGLTIPNNTVTRRALEEEVTNMRRMLRTRSLPPAPTTGEKCRHCPLGRPVRVERGRRTGLFLLRGAGWRKYHSPCGDRFQWAPPHEIMHDQNLRPVGPPGHVLPIVEINRAGGESDSGPTPSSGPTDGF